MLEGKKIGVVILAYDVEPFIINVITGLPDYVDRIYVVDDCSRDNTFEIISRLDNPRLKSIHHELNKGPGGALHTGFQESMKDGMDIVIKIDGDGQMDPDQIRPLISPIIEGRADYTKGNRLSQNPGKYGMPRHRIFGNYLLTGLTRLASGYWHISDTQNGFVAISQKALNTIDLNFCSYYGYLNDLLARLNIHNLRVMDVPMPAKYGKEKSKINIWRFIPRVSRILLRIYLWRIQTKYLRLFRLRNRPKIRNLRHSESN
jgi:glycosyltransferase involved in cell wall biosynthesis